jgi:hypothetical protein
MYDFCGIWGTRASIEWVLNSIDAKLLRDAAAVVCIAIKLFDKVIIVIRV